VHLFDGDWNENVGGQDFLVFYNTNGSYIYPKAVDADIKASGPCLSNTTFSQNYDDAITMTASHSGARSDDWVKFFYNIRYDVEVATNFSRLAFFQINADQYSHDDHRQFHFGSAEAANSETYNSINLDCYDDLVYPSDFPFRQEFGGEAPWW
jgi:hypothetical protein